MKCALALPLLLLATSASAESVGGFIKAESCEYNSGMYGVSECDKEIKLIADTFTREVFINVLIKDRPLQIQVSLDAQAHERASVHKVSPFVATLRGRLETFKHAENDANGYRWSSARGSCIGDGMGNLECTITTRDDIVSLRLKGLTAK